MQGRGKIILNQMFSLFLLCQISSSFCFFILPFPVSRVPVFAASGFAQLSMLGPPFCDFLSVLNPLLGRLLLSAEVFHMTASSFPALSVGGLAVSLWVMFSTEQEGQMRTLGCIRILELVFCFPFLADRVPHLSDLFLATLGSWQKHPAIASEHLLLSWYKDCI